MKRYFYFLFSFFFITNFLLHAQIFTPVLTQGAEWKMKDGNAPYLAGADSSGYYAFVKTDFGIRAKKFDRNAKLIADVSAGKLWYAHDESEFTMGQLLGKNLYMFTTGWDGSKKSYTLIAQRVDRTTMNVEAKQDVIAECPASYYSWKMENNGMSYAFSNSGKKMLLYWKTKSDKLNGLQYFFRVLDDSLHVRWEKEVGLHLCADSTIINSVTVDENGFIYLFTTVFQRMGLHPQYEYHLVVLRDFGTFVKDVKISIAGAHIVRAMADVCADGSVRVGGTYTIGSNDSISGTFFMICDANGYQPFISSLQSFSEDFLKRYAQKISVIVRSVPALFEVKGFFVNEDGGSTLLMEETSYFAPDPGPDLPSEFFSGDVVTIRVDENGKIKWENFMDRKMESYAVPCEDPWWTYNNGELILMYYTLDMEKEMIKAGDYICAIDADGKSSMELYSKLSTCTLTHGEMNNFFPSEIISCESCENTYRMVLMKW
ncbi:MAG: hypothetical protein HY064_15435 [Bacteroidetes bacterium]|nr:hypothetical protein [Bacteroidota bacterium]